MRARYPDLIALAPTPPIWWDELGVPRFVAFAPTLRADLYATEIALVRVCCSGCGAMHDVATSCNPAANASVRSLASRASEGRLPTIEAPAFGCCDAGPMRFLEPIRILQFWRLLGPGGWARSVALERDLPTPRGTLDEEVLDAEADDLVITVREAWLAGVRAERYRASTCPCGAALPSADAPVLCGGCQEAGRVVDAEPPSPEAMLDAWMSKSDPPTCAPIPAPDGC
jgi:hypothetical protein